MYPVDSNDRNEECFKRKHLSPIDVYILKSATQAFGFRGLLKFLSVLQTKNMDRSQTAV